MVHGVCLWFGPELKLRGPELLMGIVAALGLLSG
jgi:hypothetical protein